MNILIWILWGCLLAILVPAFLLGFTIILNKILLGKDPGTRTYDDMVEAQREKRGLHNPSASRSDTSGDDR